MNKLTLEECEPVYLCVEFDNLFADGYKIRVVQGSGKDVEINGEVFVAVPFEIWYDPPFVPEITCDMILFAVPITTSAKIYAVSEHETVYIYDGDVIILSKESIKA